MPAQYEPARAESVSPTPSSPSSETPAVLVGNPVPAPAALVSQGREPPPLGERLAVAADVVRGAGLGARPVEDVPAVEREDDGGVLEALAAASRAGGLRHFAGMDSWREIPGGWLIAFMLIFVTSVPPIVGYSTANTIAGFVYGFPMGWPIAASACIIGSLTAFMACRTVLSGHVNKLIGNDHRFVALGQVLRRDGILYLTGIRFCPLPFSLSNGFLATIPSISPLSFVISTALSTPKLLIHIFIGSRLAIIAEQGDAMPFRDKIVNYTGMIIGGAIGAAAGYIIYRRTMARADELAREEANINAAEEGAAGYEDTDTLMDPEDAADVMGDDDVSLWDNQGDDGWGMPMMMKTIPRN
ncbi:hypothetical protein TrVFT333_004867 [Trichoderma virens FT-333]|nr:hypothetical protein TrVFT333_004867 [Trichoderma virens FT-333]